MSQHLEFIEMAKLKRPLGEAKRLVVVTGAGVSAESGIPTFRDKENGLWSQFSPQHLATPEGFVQDKALVWAWYEWRRHLVMQAQPNAGHRAIAGMAKKVEQFTLVTQNVDDLHERAGSENVVHVHGEIMKSRCFSCKREQEHVLPADFVAVERIMPPKCKHCDEHLRPGVVWFGEMLPYESWRRAVQAARDCDLLICIGTSGLVTPAASLPWEARESGAMVVQVNPEVSKLDSVAHLNIRGTSAQVLPQLLESVG